MSERLQLIRVRSVELAVDMAKTGHVESGKDMLDLAKEIEAYLLCKDEPKAAE